MIRTYYCVAILAVAAGCPASDPVDTTNADAPTNVADSGNPDLPPTPGDADGTASDGTTHDASTADAAGPGTAQLIQTEQSSVGTLTVSSSSKLELSWDAPEEAVIEYKLTLSESIGGSERSIVVSAGVESNTHLFLWLKSATKYTASIVGCVDAACGDPVFVASAVTGSTEAEYWQIVASGDEVESSHKIVDDGNVMIHGIQFGDEAPAEIAGRVQIYYGSLSPDHRGITIAMTDEIVTDATTSSNFTNFTTTHGLMNPSEPATLIGHVATPQVVPTRSPLKESVRLYFEAKGADDRTRIMYLESDDGYLGRDFNTGGSTLCMTTEDYSTGGDCEPQIVLGVDGDTINPSPGLDNVRQFKIGYPTLEDWRWNGADGTFMLVTVGGLPQCGATTQRNQGYAVYTDGTWQLQYEDGNSNCPKHIGDAQSPSPVHLGDNRYKLYFGRPSQAAGKLAGGLPFLGPKVVMYADGERTGESIVDFEDWEPDADARPIHFVWPSGKSLSDTEEGYLDDFVFLAPTGDLDLQVMYTAITPGDTLPFATMAVLINP